jgi:hypothetical protein
MFLIIGGIATWRTDSRTREFDAIDGRRLTVPS